MKERIYDLHSTHTNWISVLDFYNQELDLIQTKLEKLCQGHVRKEDLPLIEHFQNQVFIQKRNFGDLKRQIRNNETLLMSEILKNHIPADKKTADSDERQKKEFEHLGVLLEQLRGEFRTFLIERGH